ncbi:hypothetical protein L7F22_041545 [Adiantum nelumboides]|nr:hypothetical protein [Adiantum nelumboides]
MLDVNATKILLKQFVSSNPTDGNPDCAYAAAVYGGKGLIKQLDELRSWFAVQTSYHFFSSSILLMYESDCTTQDGSQENIRGTVKLVDFAHVLMGQEAVDENFLQGLDTLMGILLEIAGQT